MNRLFSFLMTTNDNTKSSDLADGVDAIQAISKDINEYGILVVVLAVFFIVFFILHFLFLEIILS